MTVNDFKQLTVYQLWKNNSCSVKLTEPVALWYLETEVACTQESLRLIVSLCLLLRKVRQLPKQLIETMQSFIFW